MLERGGGWLVEAVPVLLVLLVVVLVGLGVYMMVGFCCHWITAIELWVVARLDLTEGLSEGLIVLVVVLLRVIEEGSCCCC